MKTDLKIIANVSAASLLALTALGQESLHQTMTETNSSHQDLIQGQGEKWNGAAKATDVIGLAVNNLQGEKLGKVSDLALDLASGRIVEVILSTGGFLGMGDTLTAVPPGALQSDPAQRVLTLDSSKEKLKAAPRFDSTKWDEDTQSNRLQEIYDYYGQQPYFTNAGYGTNRPDEPFANSLPRNMDGSIDTTAGRTTETAHNVEVASEVAQSNRQDSIRNPDGTWSHTYGAKDRSSTWGKLDAVESANQLMGDSVKNLQDETLGKVENFAVDLRAGRIVAVIISSGGFMGIDSTLSAVPPTAFRFNAATNTLQLDASKETLVNAPHFKANDWPDLSQADYFGGVYRAYNIEPYFPVSADNTRINVRDRDDGSVTPMDQGNSQADLDTTAQIRQAILADSGLSTDARNVKIITRDGHVTLRGPVNNADEKNRIAEIAIRIASAGNVNNQLEVLTTPGHN